MITINIGGVDKSSLIEFGTINKSDNINQQVDTASFDIIIHAGQTYRPAVNQEVEILNGATVIFGGVIHNLERSLEANGEARYRVKCKDYSFYADRQLVVEEYNDDTVNDIIADILTNFTDGTFTDTNVACTMVIKKIQFDRVTVTDAIQRLADITGYSWYIDYEKDIHFFEKNTEVAPFDITDSNAKAIHETLSITDDLSQIRNRVFIRGGEIEGNSRTEEFDGDASKLLFRLANKFSAKPTVSVGGASKTVGVDFLDDEASFDCFWNYNEKYIRFKVAPGAGTNNVDVTGIPLYNLVVQVDDPASITQYGIFEFAKTDKKIVSREDAVNYAKAELEAYKNGVNEGQFQTYEDGLRSGQIITITNTLLNVNEQFLVQSVNFAMVTQERYIYNVKLATLRTVGIIDFLIGLLKMSDRLIADSGETILEKTVFPVENISVTEVVDVNMEENEQVESAEITESLTVQALDYDVNFCVGHFAPDGTKRTFIIGGSRIG